MNVLAGIACLIALSLDEANLNAADPEVSVPLEDKSKGTSDALARMLATLAELQPEKRQAPKGVENREGIYILYGNLFKTGQSFALVALSEGGKPNDHRSSMTYDPAGAIGLGFAEWTHGSWEARGLWRIWPIWRPKGWKNDINGDSLRVTPAEKPFWPKNFGGDGIPKIVVVGEEGKYHQEHYLMCFNPNKHCLQEVAEAMAEPEYVDGWVRLYHKSPNKAEWERWTFLRWEEGRLVERAEWGEYDENVFNRDDRGYVAKSGAQDGKLVTFHLADKDNGYEITRNDQAFAHFSAAFYSGARADVDAETAYLFEKITGLPRKLCPLPASVKPQDRLEKIATIHVTGDRDAVRMLSPKR